MSDTNHAQKQDKLVKSEISMRRVVITTILIILMAIIAFVAFGLATGTFRNVMIILSIILIGALFLAIRGNPLPGQLLAPLGVMVALLYTAYNGDGLHDEILIASPLVIVLAGLLLGNWGGIIFGILTAAGLCFIGLLEMNGAELSVASALTEYDDLFIVSVAMITIALVLSLLVNRLNVSLRMARQNAEAQMLANEELRVLQADLENRVVERTEQLNQRAKQLQASAEVSRAVSSLSDLDKLLDQVTGLISDRFDFYHVGVFLLDRAGENAILKASNSPGGRKMLERGHSLAVGSKSVVGYVTQHREPRIALDVGQEAYYFDNPDLPQTRSEMALPLIVGKKLLGVLDVQSTESAAFSQDDITVLQVLADQVAIAIENSNLFTESQAALEASRRAYGELSREAWIKLLRGDTAHGYQSDSAGNVLTVEGDWSDDLVEIRQAGKPVVLTDKTLAVPFKVLDMPIGVVKLKKQTSIKDWTDSEINLVETLVGNLGEALESARLYEESQHRAERERILSEITGHVRSSTDINFILQTAVQDLAEALRVPKGSIRLLHPDANSRDVKAISTQSSHLPGNGGASNEK